MPETKKKRARMLAHNTGDQRSTRIPRKTKKAVQRWMVQPWPVRRGRTRDRIIRWIQGQRTKNGMGALRRRPDGSISAFDLI